MSAPQGDNPGAFLTNANPPASHSFYPPQPMQYTGPYQWPNSMPMLDDFSNMFPGNGSGHHASGPPYLPALQQFAPMVPHHDSQIPLVPTGPQQSPNIVLTPSSVGNAPAQALTRPSASPDNQAATPLDAQAFMDAFGIKSHSDLHRITTVWQRVEQDQNERPSKPNGPRAQNRKLIELVHYYCLLLLGVPNGERNFVLPDPLPLGSPPRLDTGGARLYNPIWEMSPKSGRNYEYIKEVSRIEDHEKDTPSFPPNTTKKDITRHVCNYFNSLRKVYTAQENEEARARRNMRNNNMRLRSRRHSRMTIYRGLIPQFKEKHGDAASEGVELVLLSDCASDECSDQGEFLSPEEAKQYRLQKGGGANAWEIRRREWRSDQYNRIVGSFRQLAVVQEQHLIAKQATSGKKYNRNGRTRVPRVLGADINAYRGPPPSGARAPFEWCISTEWAEKWNEATGERYTGARENVELPISSLVISDTEIDPEYLAWIKKELGPLPVPTEREEQNK
ncbi:hypothetical protein GLOTRDRAFT_114996 [Gloeophyllum trabeum ATCC 11539]|uniref:Uncharacterized protein n=1 Tax=Gloeophyllum trabeum (strain ATCC 11539 / FP-39264 / Madison 617) TaxID=670483 RepID=S7QHL7_GLOTA|nr:uncharacterized protein GLOTRDRAFT_114996 [Gloeophyllum trabeum ATCC 11539]EPQ58667.1 hypothetical protein GLOTRDRAFT_114996 [Gloeophyllum trabeum ATCC 11539]